MVSYVNDMLKRFKLTKEEAKAHKTDIDMYWNKVDALTLTEYIQWKMDKETFDSALEDALNKRTVTAKPKVSEVIDTSWRINPSPKCVFNSSSPWERCIYCNSVKKYIPKDFICLRYAQNPVSTVTENKISDEENQDG